MLFKIVIDLKILENSQAYVFNEDMTKTLYVFNEDKTVKCEVINVDFLSRDIPRNKSAIMFEWKCLKLLYSSKEMFRIDSQLKKLIPLKCLILEISYTFFSIFSRYFIVLHILKFLSPMFLGINNNNFSLFGFSSLSYFVFVFTTLKKKIFIFKCF